MKISPSETKRFGLSVHRATMDEIQPKEIKEYIISHEVDILILRLNNSTKHNHAKIKDLGFPLVHADTLVYYKTDLERLLPKPLKNKLYFQEVEDSNVGLVRKMIPEIFQNYQNHYMSNPLLNQEHFIDGYTEWASSFIQHKENDKISWIVRNQNNELMGFATCAFNNDQKSCEGVLYGILPEKSGGGVYGDLIRFTQDFFKQKGYNEMLVSTQVQNYAVQKVWSREGFYLFKSFDTYHVNSFLGMKNPDFEQDYVLSESDITQFGRLSKDDNPIHENDEYAIKKGFNGRISHGIRFEVELTKILGTQWPGNGTIILSTQVSYSAPVYPNVKYRIQMKANHIKKGGFMNIVVLLKNTEDKVIHHGYINCLKNDTL